MFSTAACQKLLIGTESAARGGARRKHEVEVVLSEDTGQHRGGGRPVRGMLRDVIRMHSDVRQRRPRRISRCVVIVVGVAGANGLARSPEVKVYLVSITAMVVSAPAMFQ